MPRGTEPGPPGKIKDFGADEETGLNQYTYADRVKARLAELGMVAPERPVLEEEHQSIFAGLSGGEYFDGRLPTVIRKLDLDQLSALNTLFSAWFAYVIAQTDLVASERSEAKRKKEFMWSHLRKQYKLDEDGKKRSDQQCSDETRNDYRFIKADAEYEELNVLYNCMLSVCKIAEKDMAVVSREVTINQVKMENDQRGRNYGKRVWNSNANSPTSRTPPPANPPRVRTKR